MFFYEFFVLRWRSDDEKRERAFCSVCSCISVMLASLSVPQRLMCCQTQLHKESLYGYTMHLASVGFILLAHNFPREQKTSGASSRWHADPRKYVSLRENGRPDWAVVGQRFIASVRNAWMTFHIASINCAELEGGNINSDLWGPETTSSLIADQRVAPAHRYVLCADWFCENGFCRHLTREKCVEKWRVFRWRHYKDCATQTLGFQTIIDAYIWVCCA